MEQRIMALLVAIICMMLVFSEKGRIAIKNFLGIAIDKV